MSGLSVRDGFSVARSQTRDRVENAMDLNKLFRVIDADPAIVGAGVVFIDSDFNVVTLREFQPICSVAVKRVVLREAPRHMRELEFQRNLLSSVRESKLVIEAAGAVLACGGAYLSWKVVYGGAMAAPFTGGISLVVSVTGVVAAAAGTLQCFVNASRVAGELLDPSGLDDVDSEAGYQSISAVLDGITLAGAGLSFYTTMRYVLATKAATRKSYREILRGLSRQERVALTAEVHKYRKDVLGLPKRYSNSQIKQQTYTQLRDLLAAGASINGSLLSGHLKPLAVAVYGEF
jgi:hypothetical protein